jgi:hypothetical protein
MGTLGNLGFLFSAIAVFMLVGLVGLILFIGYEVLDNNLTTVPPTNPESSYYAENMNEFKRYKKLTKTRAWLISGVIFFSIIATLIPSKETMIQMMVAHTITKENITYTTDTIKDMVDYIISKVKGEDKDAE